MRRFLLMLLVFAIPLTIVPPAGASHTMQVGIRVTPPVGRDTARLTCGWHTSCRPPYYNGRGLDWGVSDDGRRVWYRVRAYTDYYDPPYSLHVATVQLDPDTYGPCKEVIARTRRAHDKKIMAAIRFQHASRSGRHWLDLFGHSAWRLNTTAAGEMVYESRKCPWNGYHAHEWHTNGEATVAQNTAIPRAPSSRTYSRPTRITTRSFAWRAPLPVAGCYSTFC